jgi:hypothetical protein
MALTILDCTITSDHTPHTARRATDHPRHWEVSWLPGRHLTRNQAITAMTLAEVAAPDAAPARNRERLRPHIRSWAAELGMTAEQAATQITAPPHWAARETEAARPDPEAGA